jgi:ankyrin repeat protein
VLRQRNWCSGSLPFRFPFSKEKYSGRTPLLWAAENGHAAVVKLLLEKDAKPKTKGKYSDQTPLLWAAENGHEVAVKLLLEKGAELETKDNSGRTPLSYAAEKGHKVVVKLLLEKGAKLDCWRLKIKILVGRRCCGLQGMGTRRW